MAEQVYRHKEQNEEHTRSDWLKIFERVAQQTDDEMIPSEMFDNYLNDGLLYPVNGEEKKN